MDQGFVSTVNAYDLFGTGRLEGAAALDITGDTSPSGDGVYYLLRNADCESWQSAPSSEPARDDLLS